MSGKASRPASVWRSYRAQFVAERPGLSALRMALKLARERLELREVRNATFQDLSEAGYDVRTIEDGAEPFVPAPGEMPEHWKRPIGTIVPKVARLRNVELFRDGSILLPDGRYCCYDTCFLSHLEDDRYFGALGKVIPGDKIFSGPRPVMLDMFRRRRSASHSGKIDTISGTLAAGSPANSFDTTTAVSAKCRMPMKSRQANSMYHASAGVARPGKSAPPSGAICAELPANLEVVCFRPPDIGRRMLQVLDPRTGRALIRRSRKGAVAISGRCFSARSGIPDNMGHFIHDMLSRKYYEYLGVIAPGRERIIAPGFAFPMRRILFERIFEGYEIVHVPSDVAFRVEELLVPANLCSQYRFTPRDRRLGEENARDRVVFLREREMQDLRIAPGRIGRRSPRTRFRQSGRLREADAEVGLSSGRNFETRSRREVPDLGQLRRHRRDSWRGHDEHADDARRLEICGDSRRAGRPDTGQACPDERRTVRHGGRARGERVVRGPGSRGTAGYRYRKARGDNSSSILNPDDELGRVILSDVSFHACPPPCASFSVESMTPPLPGFSSRQVAASSTRRGY